MKNNKEILEQILIFDTISENDEKILFEIIPELKHEKGFSQNNPWHVYDVWNHTKTVLKNSRLDKEIRLALLLHDIGKPHSYQDDENGIRHFKGHALKSAEISEKVLSRLGYNKDEISQIVFYIENHDKTIDSKTINEDNIEKYKKLLYIQYCDASGYNPEYIKRVYDKLDKIKLEFKLYDENEIKI